MRIFIKCYTVTQIQNFLIYINQSSGHVISSRLDLTYTLWLQSKTWFHLSHCHSMEVNILSQLRVLEVTFQKLGMMEVRTDHSKKHFKAIQNT